ncbi:tryptophan dimethylallyltransferase family protein [Hyalangium rubrum]|uniref:Tryptophan dimethylallyltransferase family protein n=1 Tax=Hyalangium rubrum TaxID=3103134 RepID=A0ABU5H1H8_9BACT|nr:tryptophan dimethylallyltransferase family protein [Hyalangium sp. s54d21]MDY7227171.1 tryptophan dimethylallyltransferase family protein [Hyalangium sp. s54d21]
MKHIHGYIERWEHRLAQHEFFTRMNFGNTLEQVLSFTPYTAFVILLFQDIIRINVRLTRDPYLKKIIGRHASEDTGHDLWFLDDLKLIFPERQWDIGWLFSRENRPMRDAALALCSEIYRIQDDRLRLVFVEALEATSQVYFPMMDQHLKQCGLGQGLKFFAGHHISVEESHTLFQQEVERQLNAIEVPDGLREEALGIVDRVFESFVLLADGLQEHAGAVSRRRNWIPRSEEFAGKTFKEHGLTRLEPLARASGLEPSAALRDFGNLFAPWGERPMRKVPLWPSTLSEEHSPLEFSWSSHGGQPELRLRVEALGDNPSPATNWAVAQQLSGRLSFEYQRSLERLRRIEELFVPREPGATFAMGHAMTLRPGAPPELWVFLNPQAQGAEQAPARVEEALGRLGLARSWRSLREAMLRRPKDRLLSLALELSEGPEARVELHAEHLDATAEDVEPVLALGQGYASGEARRLFQMLAGEAGPISRGAVRTSVMLSTGSEPRAVGSTLQFPVHAYADDDRVARERIAELLDARERQHYREVLSEVARRPLEAGVGLQSAVFAQWQGTPCRMGVYLTSEAYAIRTPRNAPGQAPLSYGHGS